MGKYLGIWGWESIPEVKVVHRSGSKSLKAGMYESCEEVQNRTQNEGK